MKMRVTFLPLIALAALTTVFNVKSHKMQEQTTCSFLHNFGAGTQCYDFRTDQDDCEPSNTGAVCTTTPGGGAGTITAYLAGTTPSCQIILRQP